MSHGAVPNYADVLNTELLDKICPEEYKKFKDLLSELEISESEFCYIIYDTDDNGAVIYGNTPEEITHQALNELKSTFYNITGLILDINYHDSDNLYDDVNGLFFTVDKVWELTKAGEKYHNYITKQGWVRFG